MIDKLRKMHPNNHQAVLDMVISHQGLPLKKELVKRILSTLVMPAPVHYRSLLRRFAGLSSKATAEVALSAQPLRVRVLLGGGAAAGAGADTKPAA
jgi:acetyl-CoA carboxylase/biotin carboxylase 1